MAQNTKNQPNEANEAVGQVVSKAELFLEANKKKITIITLAIVAVVAIVLLFNQFYTKPLKAEAEAQTFVAEQYFREDNFEAALKGDGNALGFEQIIDEYGNKAGAAVYFYAGICELQLGNYAAAVDYLSAYNGKDPILKARALCCIGDAYVGLEQFENAVRYFLDAANVIDNEFVAAYLLKAGIIYEEMGKPAEALKQYEIIRTKYGNTYEGREINKYITRIQVAE